MNGFEEIYNTYFKDVYRYLVGVTGSRDTAEELCEETFFKAMRSLDSFRGDCEIRVWLCRIAKNLWLNEVKKQSRFTDADEITETLSDGKDFVDDLSDSQNAIKVYSVLHTLDEPYKEVFMLRVFGELSFTEIGKLFSKGDHWACVTFHRAKAKIQREMTDCE